MNQRGEQLLCCILSAADESGACLLYEEDLLARLSARAFSPRKLKECIDRLVLDGYCNVFVTSRPGRRCYVFTLTAKAKTYRYEKQRERTRALKKLAVTAIGAVLSFLIGLLLRKIFHT